MPRLEVQVDFDFEPPRIALRIFEIQDDGERDIVRMQRLHNLAASMRKRTDPDYPESDNRLLRQLSADLGRPALIKQNFNLLLLDRQRFDRILAAFNDIPERFLLKGGKQAYTTNVQVAPIRFELHCQGRDTLLSALVYLPDGQTRPWSLARRELQGKSLEATIHDQLVRLELPIARDLLDRVFGTDNPRVPTDALEEHLPALLDYRLDVLGGDSVEHHRQKVVGSVQLHCEGADIILRPLVGTVLVRESEGRLPVGFKRVSETRFRVTEFESDDLPALRKLIRRAAGRERANDYLIPGDPEKVATLGTALRQLPASVTIHAAQELQALLKAPESILTDVRAREGAGWFELQVNFRIGPLELSARELRELTRRKHTTCFRSRDGQWLHADAEQLATVSAMLNEQDLADGVRRSRDQAGEAMEWLQALPNLNPDGSSGAISRRLSSLSPPPPLSIPSDMQDILRPYQRLGLEFLYTRAAYGIGALLADDMGLGKTLQLLAWLAVGKAAGQPQRVLVICPASVVAVWQDEAARFVPDLHVELLIGTAEARLEQLAQGMELAVCTYAVARLDTEVLRSIEWSAIVLDEAQHIKNPQAQVTQAIRALPAKQRFALTGTPLENRLDDLWSIVDFLNPGYFGTLETFKNEYGGQSWRTNDLPRRLSPLMLRRTKDQVAPELPPRLEETIRLPMPDDQRALYLAQLHKARQQAAGQGALQILAALTRLRQICCDPRLLNENSPISSGKQECLLEMLGEALAEGHSALVFSQFPSVFNFLAKELEKRNWLYSILTGDTPTRRRQELVREFQNNPQPGVFLLSLRAAGTGLTLTKADYVFILDPWWNPAVENQAIDRTHRIGQKKPVFAYRLVTQASVEEKVLALQDEKRQLFAEVIEHAGEISSRQSTEELLALLS